MFFSALVIGGGLALLIQYSGIFRNSYLVQSVLECAVLVGPVSASLVALWRVPPPPFELVGDARRDLDQKEKRWRNILASQIFIFGMVVVENIFVWPSLPRLPSWMSASIYLFPMICIVFVGVQALYLRRDLGLLSTDQHPSDDELMQSLRSRARSLGYLVMLFTASAFSFAAQFDARIAARYLPLGLFMGVALPVLYFVYLDWQASRSG